MNFDLSPEQQMLKESAEALLARSYSFEQRRKHLTEDGGFSLETWRRFAELGWLAMLAPSNELGGSAVDLMVLAECLGRHIVVEPFIASIPSIHLLDKLANEAQRRDVLQPLIDGSELVAFAQAEPQSRFDLAEVRTTVRREGKGYHLDGAKTYVVGAPFARHLLVTARSSGEPGDAEGISLVLVPRASEGVELRPYRGVDGQAAADVIFGDVHLGAEALLGPAGEAWGDIAVAASRTILALCAEAVGTMRRAHEITLDYLKQREQFGRKIGSFQALQHRMVDLLMEIELSRSLTMAATIKLSEGASDSSSFVSAAKLRVGTAAKLISAQVVQLHGGMGMSEEYPIGHYSRRLLAIETLFGNAEFHRRAVVARMRERRGVVAR
jgi:alkylation response protein AidB-like acyl-CoA dehydrogenase